MHSFKEARRMVNESQRLKIVSGTTHAVRKLSSLLWHDQASLGSWECAQTLQRIELCRMVALVRDSTRMTLFSLRAAQKLAASLGESVSV